MVRARTLKKQQPNLLLEKKCGTSGMAARKCHSGFTTSGSLGRFGTSGVTPIYRTCRTMQLKNTGYWKACNFFQMCEIVNTCWYSTARD